MVLRFKTDLILTFWEITDQYVKCHVWIAEHESKRGRPLLYWALNNRSGNQRYSGLLDKFTFFGCKTFHSAFSLCHPQLTSQFKSNVPYILSASHLCPCACFHRLLKIKCKQQQNRYGHWIKPKWLSLEWFHDYNFQSVIRAHKSFFSTQFKNTARFYSTPVIYPTLCLLRDYIHFKFNYICKTITKTCF